MKGEHSCSRQMTANALGMQRCNRQLIHYVIPSRFLLGPEIYQNKNLEKNPEPLTLGGGSTHDSGVPTGGVFIYLSCFF